MAVVRLLVHGRDIGFSCLAPTCFFINLNTSEGRQMSVFVKKFFVFVCCADLVLLF